MSSQTFIQALVRFCNIYGTPSHIYSDNARFFITALGGNVIRHHIDSVGFSNTFTISVIKTRENSFILSIDWKHLGENDKNSKFLSIQVNRKIQNRILSTFDLVLRHPKSSEHQITDLPMYLRYRITPLDTKLLHSSKQ